jgi:hypothetical protein
MADIPVVKKSDSVYVYSLGGVMTTFREGGPHGRRCIKNSDAEKPSGEWNVLDLYCHGDTSVHVVNGKPVMVLYHQKQMENGQSLPLTSGKIQIQSEGAEIFLKGIKIQPISQLPAWITGK